MGSNLLLLLYLGNIYVQTSWKPAGDPSRQTLELPLANRGPIGINQAGRIQQNLAWRRIGCVELADIG